MAANKEIVASFDPSNGWDRKPPRFADLTGRDGYVLLQALTYAISAIDRLPYEWQAATDAADMLTLLKAFCPDQRARRHFFENARQHLDH